MTDNKSCVYVSWIGREIWRREKESAVEQETGRKGNAPQGATELEQVNGSGTYNRPRLWNWEGIYSKIFSKLNRSRNK